MEADQKDQEHASAEIPRGRQQTRLPPISHLPNEILSEIFLEIGNLVLEQLHGRMSNYPSNTFAFGDLIGLLHVCRDWRATAINLPQLWTHIHIGPFQPEWAEEMLRLSEPCQITVNAVMFAEDPTSLVEGGRSSAPTDALVLLHLLLKNRIAHLNELRLRRIYHSILPELFNRQITAPSLKTLRIACPHYALSKSFVLADEILVAPALQALSLVSCGLDWSSKLVRNLTQLRIFNIPEDHGVTFIDFLSTISDIPRLKVLTFYGWFKGGLDEVDVNIFILRRVKLPCLEELHVDFNVGFMSNFLLCIDVAPTTVIKVNTFRDTPIEPATYFSSSLYLALTRIAGMQPDIRSLRILESLSNEGPGFRVQTFQTILSHDDMNASLNQSALRPNLDVTLSWGNDPTPNSEISPAMIAFRNVIVFMKVYRRALQKLVYLEVSGEADLGTHLWRDSCSSLPDLRSILLELPSQGFFNILGALAVVSTTTGTAPGYPGLKNVVCQENQKHNMNHIRAALKHRNRLGMPLERLWLPEELGGEEREVELSGCRVVFRQDQFDVVGSMVGVVPMDNEDEDDKEYSTPIE